MDGYITLNGVSLRRTSALRSRAADHPGNSGRTGGARLSRRWSSGCRH